MNDIDKLKPCTGYCQMIGAATALLSIKNSYIIFNSPRWCALTAERELACACKEYERRLFCTEAKEADVLYGVENSLKETIDELLKEEQNPALLGIISSCSMSLIGDDIKGVCKGKVFNTNVIALDAGGFTGTFESGYKLAMLALLKNLPLSKQLQRARKVNLLGVCTAYPNWKGDLEELKRVLITAGYEIGVTLGADDVSLEALEDIPTAALNIVLVPEISLEIAEYLYEKLGQKYIVAPTPFGFKGTVDWVNKIGTELNALPNLGALENEIAKLQIDIIEEAYFVRNLFVDFNLQRVISDLPRSLTLAMFRAINNCEVDVLKCMCCYINQNSVLVNGADEVMSSFSKENIHSKMESLVKSDYQLLLSTEKDRILYRNFNKTIYFNMSMSTERIKSNNVFYAGIRGWNNFLKNFFTQVKTLEYINNSL